MLFFVFPFPTMYRATCHSSWCCLTGLEPMSMECFLLGEGPERCVWSESGHVHASCGGAVGGRSSSSEAIGAVGVRVCGWLGSVERTKGLGYARVGGRRVEGAFDRSVGRASGPWRPRTLWMDVSGGMGNSVGQWTGRERKTFRGIAPPGLTPQSE